MGWLSKLGKIALVAAPYVAAPFTGGASLMATGATNKALQKWNEKDAKKAAEKGIAPSKFDKYLGYASTGGSVASSFMGPGGVLGSAGKAATAGKAANAATTAAKTASTAEKIGGWADKLGAGAQAYGAIKNANAGTDAAYANAAQQYQVPPQQQPPIGPSSAFPQAGPNYAMPRDGAMPYGGFDWNHNPVNQYNQSNPNLATSIFQGRQEALMNQPFRSGYLANTGYDPETGEPIQQRMPPIYPNYAPPVQENSWNY